MSKRRDSSGWRELRAAWANREWRALFVAALLSQGGDQLARFALALLVFDRSGSPAKAALVFAVSFLPYLLGSAASGIGDRRPRRQVMLTCDLARVGLAVALAAPWLPIPALLMLYFVLGLAEPPFEAARAALAADLLGPDNYGAGHALQQSAFALMAGAGGLAAGVLVSVTGASGALLVNAGTFAVSAAIIGLRVKSGQVAAEPEERVSPVGGFKVIGRSPILRTVLGLAAAGAALTVPVDVLAVSIAHVDGHGAIAASVLLAAPLVGATVSNLAVTRVPADQRDSMLSRLAVATFLPVALFLFQPGFVYVCVLASAMGLFSGFQVLANQRFMLAVPPQDRSKAFGAASATIMAVQGLSSVIVGLFADRFDPERVVGVGGLVALAVVGYVAVSLPHLSVAAVDRLPHGSADAVPVA